jgi:predicted component of type VI protein secretion system
VGRGRGSDLQLPDPSVSRRHATLEQRGSGYVVIDQSSENGTFAGAERLGARAAHPAGPGELLRFGRIWVEVVVDAARPASEPGECRQLSRRLIERSLEADGKPREPSLAVTGGRHADERAPLPDPNGTYLVGSDRSATLRLSTLRQRAVELTRQGDQLWIGVLPGAGAVQLDGRVIEPGQRSPWPRKASLLVDGERLRWTDPVAEVLERVESGPTEHLAPDASVDPPVGVPLPRPKPARTPTPRPARAKAPQSTPEPAPAGAAPRPAFATNAGPERWTSADAGVFLLALVVLVASVWAIQWIARLGQA